jgi:hypothetical protein
LAHFERAIRNKNVPAQHQNQKFNLNANSAGRRLSLTFPSVLLDGLQVSLSEAANIDKEQSADLLAHDDRPKVLESA